MAVALAGKVELTRGGVVQVALVGGATDARVVGGTFGDFGGVSGNVVVLDLEDESVTLHEDALEPLVAPSVAASGAALVVVGGVRADAEGALGRRRLSRAVTQTRLASAVQVGDLATARVAPALHCLDEGCTEILVVGGNSDGPVSEVIDFTSSTTSPAFVAMASLVWPAPSRAPCFAVISSSVALTQMAWSSRPDQRRRDRRGVDGHRVENVEGIQTYAASALYMSDDGACWLFGGRSGSPGLASNAVWRVGESAVVSAGAGVNLEQARFGAVVAAVAGGELDGSVIIAGGMGSSSEDGDAVGLLPGAEIFRP